MKKIHHAPDYIKNKDADVIKHGSGPAVPNEHWQMEVGKTVFPPGSDTPAGAYLATPGKKRSQPHIKVNECDH